MTLPKRDPTTLCLPSGFFDELLGRAAEFLNSREDGEAVGAPWRLGVLLHGEPGAGKTSIAHALASTLNRRLTVVSLTHLDSDDDLASAFDGVREDSIVPIEDVDCAFHERQSVDADGFTFSGFLTCIDGVIAPQNGRILIMSTNRIDRLDPALIRPGRVDVNLEVPLLKRQAATDYAARHFPHVANRHELVDEVPVFERPTSAMLINRLMQQSSRRDTRSSGESPRNGHTTPTARRPERAGFPQ